MRRNLIVLFLMSCAYLLPAQEVDSVQLYLDSLEAGLNYQHGEIKFENGIGTLNVPKGFRYLDAEQAEYVLRDLWGNPEGSGTLGMIVPETPGVTAPNGWAFIITYEDMGYVKDDDADDIDYDELMETMQSDSETENAQRTEQGYEPITIVGWASKPFYDKDKKVLHWAKEIKFGESEMNTLNYNIRVLGRKGVVVLNAVASMSELGDVQKNIEPVLASFNYTDGNKYADFDPDIDEVAAWTIGGLVAGKMLAKAGLLAMLLKYIKLIGLGAIAIGTAAWKWFKKKTEQPTVRNISDTNNS